MMHFLPHTFCIFNYYLKYNFEIYSYTFLTKISWKQILSFTCNGFTKYFSSAKKLIPFHNVRGNYGISLTHFWPKFRESKGFTNLSKLLKSWFDEIFFQWERISREFWGGRSDRILLQNFREVEWFITELFSRKWFKRVSK